MSKQIQLKQAVLLVNLGTPSAPTPKAVRRFLRQFLSDTRVVDLARWLWLPILYGVILPFRGQASARNYQKIWSDHGSPLMHYCQQLTLKLQRHVDDNTEVALAMCYGDPSIPDALERLRQHNIKELTIIPMYPQYSATTTAAALDQIFATLKKWRWVPKLHVINQYADHPLYIEAMAHSIQAHFNQHGQPDQLLFSFHGIPQRFFDQGDPYYCYCHKTARLIAERLELPPKRWQMVFQSRFGREPWLQPYCDKTLEALPAQGVKSVAVVCPGFSVDCLETLEEIAMTNQRLFLEAGGEHYHYIPALNDCDGSVQLFLDLMKHSRAAATRELEFEVVSEPQ